MASSALRGLPGGFLGASLLAPFALHLGEAFHRGEAHPEELGSLNLGGASLEGFDYLASEVF